MSRSATSPELFRNIVETVFNDWTALRLAVHHGMASKEEAINIVDYVTQLFLENQDIASEEVGDILEDLMDTEFQTLCEDNSAAEVGEVLWQFHQLCLANDKAAIQSELSKLSKCELWLSKPLTVNNQTLENNTMESTEGAVECDMACETNDETNSIEQKEGEGWTKVRNRKKK